MKCSALKEAFYLSLAGVFPLSFVLRCMEKGKATGHERYEYIAKVLPETACKLKEEQNNELELLSQIEKDVLNYIGSVVLGMTMPLWKSSGHWMA